MLNPIKVLVVGAGSIGRRHLRNLRTLGVRELRAVEPDRELAKKLDRELEIIVYDRVKDGLEWPPDAVVIATPGHLHLEQARIAVENGLALFVEKPLGITEEGLDDLARRVQSGSLVSMVGCNMRFHPMVAKAHELLKEGAIGKLWFGRYFVGSHLPGWRPESDYRTSYSADPGRGGGVILDCIHELDLAVWFQGPASDVTAAAGQIALGLPVEDIAVLVNRHAGGTFSDVHMDYLQQSYERGLRLVGEHGSIHWDYRGHAVKLYDARTDRWMVYEEEDGYDWNTMYLDEMRHFFEAAATGGQTTLPVPDAVHVTKLALRAKQSAASGQRMRLEEG